MTVLLSVTGLLLLAAFVTCVVASMNKSPLWVAVMFVILANLIALLLGRV